MNAKFYVDGISIVQAYTDFNEARAFVVEA